MSFHCRLAIADFRFQISMNLQSEIFMSYYCKLTIIDFSICNLKFKNLKLYVFNCCWLYGI